jgi:two-component system sensor histidine kinase UhpB
LGRFDRMAEMPKSFPDWDPITSHSLQPGQCLELHGTHATSPRSRCAGVDASAMNTPVWFFQAYRSLISPYLAATRPIPYGAKSQGTIVATLDPKATAAKAWSTIAPLIGLSAVFVSALCFVAYIVIDRALRPAKEILSALNGLARGDLTCRLPAFRLTELNRISEVFNALSADLSRATAERAELARRLVDAQEQERRHIARELHDEIAQKLSALSAVAACVRTSARDAPDLVDETKELERMASDLMVSLRKTLTYLRPQVIDDLGLIQSLQSLVDEQNNGARGQTDYSMEVAGDVEQLGAETSAHVYRIVQEALNNASKHANARRVKVQLNQRPGPGQEMISLVVLDDGAGPADEPSHPTGSGIIGMRERVAALSGKLAAGPLPGGGFGLKVEFPTLRSGGGA